MKALANAKAYVAYARAHPGMYGLMFRTERLDMSRPSLHEAASASFAGFANAVGASRSEQITGNALEALSLDQAAAIARAWSLVHGFTTLLLDGRLEDILHRLPEGNASMNCWTPCCARPCRGRRRRPERGNSRRFSVEGAWQGHRAVAGNAQSAHQRAGKTCRILTSRSDRQAVTAALSAGEEQT